MNSLKKLDLHTHSVASPDGGLSQENYEKMLARGGLDAVAVTDHNTIEMALKLHQKHGERIIVGEEITCLEGEIVGLYLHVPVPAGLSADTAAKAIRQQGGLVYIPHPFETVRKGLPLEVLNSIAGSVDIIETRNGRALFQNFSKQASDWAVAHQKAAAASSDAHGWHGWGKTYSEVSDVPGRETLIKLLLAGRLQDSLPGIRMVLYPKYNRLKSRRRRA